MRYVRIWQQGITLIEVLAALSIIAVMVVVIGFSVTSFVDARSELLNNTKAVYLAEEGYEILRALRNDDWSIIDALVIGDTNYFAVATTTIAVSGTPEVIDGEFYRSFKLSSVYRDGDDDITDSTTPGAVVDTEILEVTVSVFGPTGTTSLTAILSNIFAI